LGVKYLEEMGAEKTRKPEVTMFVVVERFFVSFFSFPKYTPARTSANPTLPLLLT